MSRILLVEDNRSYAATLAANLEREGYEVRVAATGTDGLRDVQAWRPDLMILDLMLPALGGFTVLQRAREAGLDTPVLIMTARGTEDEKLRGFALGADDYVVKPCSLLELLARVRALLKRTAGSAAEPTRLVQIADLTIDFGVREVRRGDETLALRPKEFDLLAALVRRRGKLASRAELLSEVWGYASDSESRTVETHLAALRQRLGDDPTTPRYIITVRGAGYRLAAS